MRPKLTEEDVAWLEERLTSTMVPVSPRPEFIQGVKRTVLNGAADADDDERYSAVGVLSALLLGLGLTLLVFAIARRRMRWSR